MRCLSKEEFLDQPVKIVAVPISEDTCVYVREMSGTAKSRLEDSMVSFTKGKDMTSISSEKDIVMNAKNIRLKYACCCLCDEQGNLLFTIEEAELLGSKISSRILELIVDEADKINHYLTKESKDAVTKN